jgi:hypothetical protein
VMVAKTLAEFGKQLIEKAHGAPPGR